MQINMESSLHELAVASGFMFSLASESVCISSEETKIQSQGAFWFHGLVPAGSFTPHGSPCVRQSQVSITTGGKMGVYVCVCQRGGKKGV